MTNQPLFESAIRIVHWKLTNYPRNVEISKQEVADMLVQTESRTFAVRQTEQAIYFFDEYLDVLMETEYDLNVRFLIDGVSLWNRYNQFVC